MSILVLGAAGYIGSHTAKALLSRGKEVVIADNLQTGFRCAVPKGAKFYEGDIRDGEFLNRVFESERIDSVIHFAASSQVGESMKAPLKYYDNNLYGTMCLLKAMSEHGADKLVFSSSAAVYGEPVTVPIRENAPVLPTNCYGETKLSMERMIRWTAQAHGLRFVALRYFNACGAEPDGSNGESHRPETHLIPIVLQAALGQRDGVSIFGDDYPTADGTCVRDYVHVCDLAQAHILALEYLEKGGDNDVFNLGNGSGFSVREVLECARRVTGEPIPAAVSPRRAGDPAFLVACSDKAKSVLGWRPEYPELEDIIRTAWLWHKNHPGGYEA